MNDHRINNESEGMINDADLRGKFKHAWVEENFPQYVKNGQSVKIAETRDYVGSSLNKKKIFWLLVAILFCLVVVFSRIFYLQVLRGDYYRSLAENNRIRIKPITAERGLVYDREGRQLIENVPSFSLTVVPQDLPQKLSERNVVIERIAKISGLDATEIADFIKKYSTYSYESLTIIDNLDYDTALSLYIANADLPGIVIEKGTKRLYRTVGTSVGTSVFSLGHLIGYLGKINEDELENLRNDGYLTSDSLGKSGLEKQYEKVLRGVYGRKRVEVNALGREQSVLAEEPPIPGNNLILTVDLEAQQILENIVSSTLAKNNWQRAAAIAMDPRNGEILAMVSWPPFNNNDFSGGISQEKYSMYLNNLDKPLFNRAIAGTYPSGSIVKPIIAAAALQEGIITRYTSFLSTGGLQVNEWFFKDWKAGGHGQTNVTKAIAWSVNTFFYYIGGGYKSFVGLGVDKITEYLKKFGLSQKTGIDLPSENEGFLPSKEWKEKVKNERWYVGDTYNLSIGQGDLLVTPLQAAVWTAAVANGGKVVVPHLVGAYYDPVAKEQTAVQALYKEQDSVSAVNMAIVKQGMRECVTYGSCQLLGGLPFTSGGKTGTAQWSGIKDDHAWFTAFAPYNNPQIIITVLVEEGKEGSTAAMPMARQFLDWWGRKYLK